MGLFHRSFFPTQLRFCLCSWSRERAVQYLLDNTASSKHEIESEIDRYITWPGQACGYKIGEIRIKQLRKKAEDALGELCSLWLRW